MSGTKLKDLPRGTRILQSVPDVELVGKQAALAVKFGVSQGTIHRERTVRKMRAA